MPNFVKIRQSVAKVLRFFDFSRWRPSPSWIFDIVNFYMLMVSGGLSRITVPNFINIGRFVVEILRFFEFSRWPPPPSWIFEIAKFYCLLRSRRTRRISVRFCQNRWIGCEDIKIFGFFKIAAIMDSFEAYLDYSRWVLGGLYHSAKKFGYDRYSSFYNMNISIFGTFGWKMPIHAPKIGVLGQFDPLNGLQYQP